MVFRPNNTYETSTAHHDRIQLEAFRFHLSGVESDIAAFFGTLSNLSHQNTDNDEQEPYSLFSRPQTPYNRVEVKFASRIVSNRIVVGAPLIDGKYIFNRSSRPVPLEIEENDLPTSNSNPIPGSQPITYIGKAEITLNPTRAFVHQNHSSSRRIVGNRRRLSMYTRELSQDTSERPINPLDDNVILGSSQRHSRGYGSHTDFTNRYINTALMQIIHYLQDALETVRRDGLQIEFRASQYINVKQIETYWTLPSETPFDDLMRIEPGSRALGSHSQRRIYSNVISDLETEGNVPSVATRVASGIRAKLYPKTNRSLRFEFTHDLRHATSVTTRHTFDGDDAVLQLCELLRLCREDASEHAQRLANILIVDEENENHFTPYRLVTEIIRASEDQAEQLLLFEILINNSAYRHIQNDPLRLPIRTLLGREVVQRVAPRARTVRLTSQYERARRILANNTPPDFT